MSLESYGASDGEWLRQEYELAAEHYSSVVKEMSRPRGSATDEDFEKLTQRFHEARNESAAALHALKLFQHEHP